VGGFSYGVEMAVLFVFRKGLHWSPITSVAISFWIGLIVAFILQKYVTFKNRDKRPRTIANQIVGHGALVAWNYVFTLALVKVFVPTLSVFIVRTLAIMIITIWNFAAYKILFRHAKEQ
jgi:putative flippase GtrA